MFCLQVLRGFILLAERSGFILRMKDIIQRAKSLMPPQPVDGALSPEPNVPTPPESTVRTCDQNVLLQSCDWLSRGNRHPWRSESFCRDLAPSAAPLTLLDLPGWTLLDLPGWTRTFL